MEPLEQRSFGLYRKLGIAEVRECSSGDPLLLGGTKGGTCGELEYIVLSFDFGERWRPKKQTEEIQKFQDRLNELGA